MCVGIRPTVTFSNEKDPANRWHHFYSSPSPMRNIELYIGVFAGICTAISLLPQLLKIIREKKANAISYGMLSILMLGLISWIIYGALKTDYPIIITNSVSLMLNILITIFTVKYKSRSA